MASTLSTVSTDERFSSRGIAFLEGKLTMTCSRAPKVVDFSNEVLEQLDNGGWGGRGRVTLLGDAAHAMRPTDGQGGNQAFEDAVVLSRTLLHAFEKESVSIVEALREFEAIRLPRVKRIHDDQRERYEKRMRGESVGPMSKEFREWIEQGV